MRWSDLTRALICCDYAAIGETVAMRYGQCSGHPGHSTEHSEQVVQVALMRIYSRM